LQMNVSSECCGGALNNSIGPQGKDHVDGKDAPRTFTLMAMLLSFPPGSDAGDFLLARPGLYIREQNATIVWAAFKGNDLHSGNAPTAYNMDDCHSWQSS
ncbi:hypothetical protein FA95DRAFT_1478374, partial [Auriscalpium vulgare]